jgi:hypothetical protein
VLSRGFDWQAMTVIARDWMGLALTRDLRAQMQQIEGVLLKAERASSAG